MVGLEAKEGPRLPANPQELGRRKKGLSHTGFRGSMALLKDFDMYSPELGDKHVSGVLQAP